MSDVPDRGLAHETGRTMRGAIRLGCNTREKADDATNKGKDIHTIAIVFISFNRLYNRGDSGKAKAISKFSRYVILFHTQHLPNRSVTSSIRVYHFRKMKLLLG